MSGNCQACLSGRSRHNTEHGRCVPWGQLARASTLHTITAYLLALPSCSLSTPQVLTESLPNAITTADSILKDQNLYSSISKQLRMLKVNF